MTSTDAVLGLDHADSVALLRRQTEILELIAARATLAEVLTGIAVALEDLVPGCRCSVLLLDPGGARPCTTARRPRCRRSTRPVSTACASAPTRARAAPRSISGCR